ncbi:MAG TPA: GNAT family N-acetyltransferase [Hyphomicrobiaceae bacterium]|jgi:RimJ/RimL family protein N-acetyltransferase
MRSLASNNPLDLATLGSLLTDRAELALVWPDAVYPFNPEQWRSTLTAGARNRSYFVMCDGEIIGHAALLETEELDVLSVSYLFIRADHRNRGHGRQLMSLLERKAMKVPGITSLRLRVRTFNPRAAHVYEASGFVVTEQEGTLRIMRKRLPAGQRSDP